jgi:Glycosyltransferase family 87
LKPTKPILHWLVLCGAALIFLVAGGTRFSHGSSDFVPVYTGALCLVHACNPYDTAQLEQQFYLAGGHPDEVPSWSIEVPVYPPSTFLVLSPLAALPYPLARLFWFLLNACLYITSAVLVRSLCPQSWLATLLVSLFLLASGILSVLGQPALFAISLVVVGTNLFLRGRLLPLAAILFLLSLAVKPQIGGLILLYLLLRRIHWPYAAAAMAGSLVILVSAGLILKHHPRSASWSDTLKSNLSATLGPGGSADPRPANPQAIGDINLQALTSIFFNESSEFNTAAYVLFACLTAAWMFTALRAMPSMETNLLALAALAILSLTPVYHRFYDTRLLLLTIPAVVLISRKHRILGACMTALTVLTVISLQYRVQAYLLQQGKLQSLVQHKLLFVAFLRQQNLVLLLLFCLYLVAIRSLRESGVATAEPAILLHQ